VLYLESTNIIDVIKFSGNMDIFYYPIHLLTHYIWTKGFEILNNNGLRLSYDNPIDNGDILSNY
jgi:hypothetical protein